MSGATGTIKTPEAKQPQSLALFSGQVLPGRKDLPAAWYEDAVFYELHVKAFYDANGDGLGDFAGLVQKLDYIQDLGATCIWLLPFYPSSMRDDGYDVTDYRAIHPSLGTMDDFRAFVREAHQRGLKIAAEMVINHTSDQHPWFQAARSAPSGSPLRDYYVWSDQPHTFCDGEPDGGRSHWSWDGQAQAYYFHRFHSFQPDLNYGNSEVVAEMLKVLRFWAELGVDGLCLSGAEFLVERAGTACKHLPETHAVHRRLRRELGEASSGVMVQAGLNAWPVDAATYFGDGDECHTVPNLPLAQRMLLALRQEDRQPLVDLLEQTPYPPAGCQWITLLRNHDELALALATDEERDYLFREYAADPAMRLKDGILRRLAPLAENNRRRIELLFGLLFSLPGTPVIYYGDELGMGDNVHLGNRNGVRTPMQWTAARTAGFSTAEVERLYTPPVQDPVYGCQAVNVESQRRDPSSLLHWMRRLIALRRRHPAFSRGSLELLEPENGRVFACLRRLPPVEPGEKHDGGEGETILVVANLSRHAQPAEIDLSAFAGLIPVEMFGGAPFPQIGAAPYLMTLCPHSFYWFQLQRSAERHPQRRAAVPTEEVERLPAIDVAGPWDALFDGAAREALEQTVLPGFLRAQRWFGGKARKIEAVRIADWGRWPVEGADAYFVFLDVCFDGGACDRYFLPLAVIEGATGERMLDTMRPWVLATLTGPQGEAVLVDALADDAVCAALLDSLGAEEELSTSEGTIRFQPTKAYLLLRGDAANGTRSVPTTRPLPGGTRSVPTTSKALPVVRGPATSSNSLLFYGRRLLLKLFRRLEPGTNPDVEIGRFLTEQRRFSRTPPVAGTFHYDRAGTEQPYTLGILQALVTNQGDGWSHALEELGRYYERCVGRLAASEQPPVDPRPPLELARATPPLTALEAIGPYLYAARALGRRTAEMHLALASDTQGGDFAPLPLTAGDMAAIQKEIRHQADLSLAALQANVDRLPETTVPEAQRLLSTGPPAIDFLIQAVSSAVPQAAKTRIHGDYHLGQVLWVDHDYVILDFEGEPTRTVAERRAKYSPVRDVAGMLRSYHYAAFAGLYEFTRDRPDDLPGLVPWAEMWHQWTSAAFLREYLATAGKAAFVPQDFVEFAGLLDAFVLAKALYELAYELNNRPNWVRIPLSGVTRLLGLENHGETR